MKKNILSPWPSFTKEEGNAVRKILLTNKVNYWTGTKCREFEDSFSKFANTKYAIALSNGTVALEIALRAIGIQKNDEVLVSPRTYIASASSIINCGAKPIFVDVDLNSQNIDPEKIQKHITKKTKAIICVHLAGWPCEMKEILKISKKNKLKVIEDCAQAHGAKINGKSVGSFGDIGCWSFCQDKIMTTGGEGGMVTTNSKNFWKNMWEYKDHGKSFNAMKNKTAGYAFKWVHNSIGTNFRMTEMQAAIGLIQLKRMKNWNRLRNKNQNQIWEHCKKFQSLQVPNFDAKDNIHGAYKSYVFVNKKMLKKGWDRDKIIAEISKRNIPCFSGSCSEVYMEKAFANSVKPKKRLINARMLGETSLCFLIHPTIDKSQIELTKKIITEVMTLATRK